MADGRVLDQGPHLELMERNTGYMSLMNSLLERDQPSGATDADRNVDERDRLASSSPAPATVGDVIFFQLPLKFRRGSAQVMMESNLWNISMILPGLEILRISYFLQFFSLSKGHKRIGNVIENVFQYGSQVDTIDTYFKSPLIDLDVAETHTLAQYEQMTKRKTRWMTVNTQREYESTFDFSFSLMRLMGSGSRIWQVESVQGGRMIKAEKVEVGSVPFSTYLMYLRCAGGYAVSALVLLVFAVSVVSSSFSSWWLAHWLDAGSAVRTRLLIGCIFFLRLFATRWVLEGGDDFYRIYLAMKRKDGSNWEPVGSIVWWTERDQGGERRQRDVPQRQRPPRPVLLRTGLRPDDRCHDRRQPVARLLLRPGDAEGVQHPARPTLRPGPAQSHEVLRHDARRPHPQPLLARSLRKWGDATFTVARFSVVVFLRSKVESIFYGNQELARLTRYQLFNSKFRTNFRQKKLFKMRISVLRTKMTLNGFCGCF